jgi:hypothetical protein
MMGCYPRHSPPLGRFQFQGWVNYLYSFRASPEVAQRPSQLSYLFVGHDRLVSTSAPPDIG